LECDDFSCWECNVIIIWTWKARHIVDLHNSSTSASCYIEPPTDVVHISSTIMQVLFTSERKISFSCSTQNAICIFEDLERILEYLLFRSSREIYFPSTTLRRKVSFYRSLIILTLIRKSVLSSCSCSTIRLLVSWRCFAIEQQISTEERDIFTIRITVEK